jgi:hypothetical protein
MFSQHEITYFPSGIEGVVEEDITPYEPGLAKVQGQIWRAELYEFNCQVALRSGQPLVAIARRGNCLLVIPLHCLLWDKIVEDYQTYREGASGYSLKPLPKQQSHGIPGTFRVLVTMWALFVVLFISNAIIQQDLKEPELERRQPIQTLQASSNSC